MLRMVTYLSPGYPRTLFEALAGAAGATLAVDESRSGPEPDDDPFADGRADLGWVCASSYVELTSRAEPSVVLAGVRWAPADTAGSAPAAGAVYWSDVVVPTDSPVRDLEDLAGRRIGANDEASLSGHHGLRIELAHRGLDPDRFAQTVFTGSHHRSIDAVLAGELDAAAIDSTVRARRERDPAAAAALRVVARCGPWPTQPLVARAGLPPAAVEVVRTALLAEPPDPAVGAELRAAGLSGLVPVGEADYSGLRAALAAV